MGSEISLSARTRLIKTRRGAWVDESLFPEARRECREIIERVARESRDDGIVEMLRGNTKHLEKYPLGDRIRELREAYPNYFYWETSLERNEAALNLFAERLCEHGLPFELPEEYEARLAALEGAWHSGTCGRLCPTFWFRRPSVFRGRSLRWLSAYQVEVDVSAAGLPTPISAYCALRGVCS